MDGDRTVLGHLEKNSSLCLNNYALVSLCFVMVKMQFSWNVYLQTFPRILIEESWGQREGAVCRPLLGRRLDSRSKEPLWSWLKSCSWGREVNAWGKTNKQTTCIKKCMHKGGSMTESFSENGKGIYIWCERHCLHPQPCIRNCSRHNSETRSFGIGDLPAILDHLMDACLVGR